MKSANDFFCVNIGSNQTYSDYSFTFRNASRETVEICTKFMNDYFRFKNHLAAGGDYNPALERSLVRSAYAATGLPQDVQHDIGLLDKLKELSDAGILELDVEDASAPKNLPLTDIVLKFENDEL